jgi:hypothetical protein
MSIFNVKVLVELGRNGGGISWVKYDILETLGMADLLEDLLF